MRTIYYCEDAEFTQAMGGASAWLESEYSEELDTCRPATSEEVTKLWQFHLGNFNGEELDLADGTFKAVVETRTERLNKDESIQWEVIVLTPVGTPILKPLKPTYF